MSEWVIDKKDELETKWREELGHDEYEHRKAIASTKEAEFPDSKWREQMIFGGQFESLAMQMSQELFDQMAEKKYTQWVRLIETVLKKN